VLSHAIRTKAVRRHEAANGKDVNSKVDIAIGIGRRTPPQPIGRPWKQKMATVPGQAPPQAQFQHIKAPVAPASP